MRVNRWDQRLSSGETNELLNELAHAHLAEVCSAVRERFDELCRSDLPGLCDLSVPYERLSAADAYHLRQVQAFWSKRRDLDFGIDREAVALEKFRVSEASCKLTNEMFRLWAAGRFQFRPRVEQVFFLAQRKIQRLLGDVPQLSELRLRFGPGATTQVKKKDACAALKLGQRVACSEDLLPYVQDVLEEMPALLPSDGSDVALVPVEIHTGRLAFVPKSYKECRSIVVEPWLNQMVQLGIGDYISQRLRRIGIDTRDQGRNQALAREGSVTGALATLDLSSASDSISRELVYHLLPLDWALFLDHFRTGCITVGSEQVHLEKFSSMGNGFTFPLETLIFWALAASCCERDAQSDVSVYGDDIIVPTDAVGLLSEVLVCAGFTLNAQKSFWAGPFRESCGKDYLSGIDIRPCYVKDALDGASLFVLHNFYVRRGMEHFAEIVLKCIDPALRVFGPDGYGDGHLLGAWDPKPHNREKGWCGYLFDTYTWKPRKAFRVLPGDCVLPAYSTYLREDAPVGVHLTRLGRPDVLELPGVEYRRGIRGNVLPGTRGYHRISVYTLTA